MNIRVKPVWIALALASTGAQAVPVHDWYAGVGGGWAIAHDLNDFSQDVSKDATALSLFGGYNFTENLGAEIGYLSTGDWDISGHDFNSKGATLSVIGRLPLSEMFSVFAEGGGYIYHVESVNGGDDNLAPLAGLGLTARLHDWVDLQARYRYIVRVGDDPDNGKANSGTQRWVSDVSTATLELVIHPNRSQPAEPAPTEPAPAEPPPAEPAVVPAPSPAPPALCHAWADLSASEADRLVQRLRRIGITAARSRSETPEAWWVRIPPQRNRGEAERRVVELNLLGVSDTFIVQESGPNQNAVSLGLFKTENRARILLGQLRAKGVENAGIEPRMSTSYRIQANVPANELRIVESAAPWLRAKRQACTR